MIRLALGVLLWSAAHLFRRLAPDTRRAMDARLGTAARGIVALAIFVALGLMVLGYRDATPLVFFRPPDWAWPVNNLLMLVAVALYGVGSSKSRLRERLRHPMLAGTVIWAAAHLLVNADLPSLLLFGGLLTWAVAEIMVINRADPAPPPFEGGTLIGDIRLAVTTLAVFVAIVVVHTWLGRYPLAW